MGEYIPSPESDAEITGKVSGKVRIIWNGAGTAYVVTDPRSGRHDNWLTFRGRRWSVAVHVKLVGDTWDATDSKPTIRDLDKGYGEDDAPRTFREAITAAVVEAVTATATVDLIRQAGYAQANSTVNHAQNDVDKLETELAEARARLAKAIAKRDLFTE